MTKELKQIIDFYKAILDLNEAHGCTPDTSVESAGYALYALATKADPSIISADQEALRTKVILCDTPKPRKRL